MGTLGTFALGVTAALAARSFATPLGRWARPILRGAVKQGIILSQGAQVRAAGLREDLEDLVAEAREEAAQDSAPSAASPTSAAATPVSTSVPSTTTRSAARS